MHQETSTYFLRTLSIHDVLHALQSREPRLALRISCNHELTSVGVRLLFAALRGGRHDQPMRVSGSALGLAAGAHVRRYGYRARVSST